jgi:hypothetical protein
MSSNLKLKKLRARALRNQGGLCVYCEAALWDGDPTDFIDTHGVTPAQAAVLRCTAEHLQALSDGGTTTEENIAAACFVCNRGRHKPKRALASADFRRRVRAQVAKRKWHAPWVFAAHLIHGM